MVSKNQILEIKNDHQTPEQQAGESASPEPRKIGLIIFFVLLLSYIYFPQDFRNDNVISRTALTLSILQEGTVRINPFRDATRDIAYFEGNYYSDKAPGVSFTSLPINAIVYYLLGVVEPNPLFICENTGTSNFLLMVFTSTIFTSSLFTALSALVLYAIARQVGASLQGAIFAMLSFGLATQAWGWATALFGHAMAGACLFLGFSAIFYTSNYKYENAKLRILGFIAGASLAWAIVVEYTAAMVSGMIALYGFYQTLHLPRNSRIQFVILFCSGFLLFLLPLFIYNQVAFGNPFSIGYVHEQGFEGLQKGFFGITLPNLSVLLKIIISPHRGLLWFSPILWISPIGIYFLWRDVKTRIFAYLIIAIAIYYLLVNSGYYYWDGGFSTGPRHLTPILPFLCLPIALVWSHTPASYKPALVCIFFISFTIALMSVSITMFSQPEIQNPLFDMLIPRFFSSSGGGNNIVLLSIRNLNEPLRSLLLDRKWIRQLSAIPILIVWIVGYVVVANKVDKLSKGYKQNSTPRM